MKIGYYLVGFIWADSLQLLESWQNNKCRNVMFSNWCYIPENYINEVNFGQSESLYSVTQECSASNLTYDLIKTMWTLLWDCLIHPSLQTSHQPTTIAGGNRLSTFLTTWITFLRTLLLQKLQQGKPNGLFRKDSIPAMELTLGQWNVLTLNRQGDLHKLLTQLDRYHVKLAAIQKIRCTRQGDFNKRSHTIFLYIIAAMTKNTDLELDSFWAKRWVS